TLHDGSTIVGNVSTAITSEYEHVTLFAHAHAGCSCLGGDTDSNATVDVDTDARVVGLGPSSPASTIETSDLTVTTNQQIDRYQRDATTSEGFLDFGNGGDSHGS